MDGPRRLRRTRDHLPRHRHLSDFCRTKRRSERGRRDAGRDSLDGQSVQSDRGGRPCTVRRLQPGRSAIPADQSATGEPRRSLPALTAPFISVTAKRLYGQEKF